MIKARLVIQTGERERIYRIVSPIVTIGRSETNDIVLLGKYVSKEHARLEIDGSRFFLIDLGKNPSRVNGSPVFGSQELKRGDEITIGGFKLRFEGGDEGGAMGPFIPVRSERETETVDVKSVAGERTATKSVAWEEDQLATEELSPSGKEPLKAWPAEMLASAPLAAVPLAVVPPAVEPFVRPPAEAEVRIEPPPRPVAQAVSAPVPASSGGTDALDMKRVLRRVSPKVKRKEALYPDGSERREQLYLLGIIVALVLILVVVIRKMF